MDRLVYLAHQSRWTMVLGILTNAIGGSGHEQLTKQRIACV